MQRSETVEKLPLALSNRALQSSKRTLSASSAIGNTNEGGMAWMSATTLRKGDRVLEAKQENLEPKVPEWTLFDGESFHLDPDYDE